jgi:hypothetical protein
MASASASASDNNNIKTYRFEFSKSFINELSRFSKVHQYDERHTYKKEWSTWKSDSGIAEIMEMEKRRLEENGYIGNIEDKMFKSGRYYFRKKTTATATATTPAATTAVTPATPATPAIDEDDETRDDAPKTPKTPSAAVSAKIRKPYITMSKSCIRMMDAHITTHSTTTNFKPSSCYDDFYNKEMTSPEMAAEIEKIIEKYDNVRRNRQPLNVVTATSQTVEDITNEIMDKIKKTYKNRYYRFVNNTTTTSGGGGGHDEDHE